MKAIAELSVQDVDATPPRTSPLFVRCCREAPHDADAKMPRGLVVEVICAPDVYQARISASHKPRALDCSAFEYLAALEAVFTPTPCAYQGEETTRFKFKWSLGERVLTLMENATDAGFAMKYTSITFDLLATADSATTHGSYWSDLLHGVVQQSEKVRADLAAERRKHRELEMLLRDKDAVLERALQAKQGLEERLFEGFCAVLNAKKDEIQRLRTRVASGDQFEDVSALVSPKAAPASRKKKTAPRKKSVAKRPRRVTDAKLSRAEPKEQGDQEPSGKHSPEASSDDTQVGENEESDDAAKSRLESRRKRAKNDSTHLSPVEPVRSGSTVHARHKQDIPVSAKEADAMTISGDEPPAASWRARSRATSAPSSPNMISTDAVNAEACTPKAVAPEPLPTANTSRVSPTKAADSEEEDIWDMLS